MFDESSIVGGGFFTEPNDVSSPGKPRGQVQRVQSIVPVCVRQLRDCEEDEFKLFGVSTQILTLVGILRGYEVHSTKATYQVEDHTGSIEAIWWLENDSNSTPNLPLVKEGRYLKVYGSLRVQEHRKVLMVLRMFPIDDINEITTHLLQVIHTRLAVQNNGNATLNILANNPSADLANTMSFMDEDSRNNSGLTLLQEKVFNILKPITSVTGLASQDILRNFPPNQHRDVRSALEFLINEGHAYSTIDNDHFKVTESM